MTRGWSGDWNERRRLRCDRSRGMRDLQELILQRLAQVHAHRKRAAVSVNGFEPPAGRFGGFVEKTAATSLAIGDMDRVVVGSSRFDNHLQSCWFRIPIFPVARHNIMIGNDLAEEVGINVVIASMV